MTKRAKRLAVFLEKLDWNVFEAEFRCCPKRSCIGVTLNANVKFCEFCGSKFPSPKFNTNEVLEELENAIQYALSKKK